MDRNTLKNIKRYLKYIEYTTIYCEQGVRNLVNGWDVFSMYKDEFYLLFDINNPDILSGWCADVSPHTGTYFRVEEQEFEVNEEILNAIEKQLKRSAFDKAAKKYYEMVERKRNQEITSILLEDMMDIED